MSISSQFQNVKALVIGLGISGRAAVEALLSQGACVTAVDAKALQLLRENADVQALQQKGAAILAEDAPIDLTLFSLIVVSPGIPGSHPLYQQALERGIETIGEVELACRLSSGNRWVGVTGTNGKTTVTLLITHVLKACGKSAVALGNVGTPLSTYKPSSSDEIIVAELSSFQLERMEAKVLSHALLLNVTPDHLDRYDSMAGYARAKFKIFDCVKDSGGCYIEEQTAKEWGCYAERVPHQTYGFSPASSVYSDGRSIYFNSRREIDLPSEYAGKKTHDLSNYLAAYSICRRLGIEGEEFKRAAALFKKPSHRIQFVAECGGIAYIDDSKGTNLDAVIRAVESIDRPIVLIAGGIHKGASYEAWLPTFKGKVKAVCAIGQASKLIFNSLSSQIPVEICETLDQAVSLATKFAKKGECVLLSPGCSSYDMFRDYVHRGEEFVRCVHALRGE